MRVTKNILYLMLIAALLVCLTLVQANCESNCPNDSDCANDWSKCQTGYCCGKILDANGAFQYYKCVSSSTTTYGSGGTVSCVTNELSAIS